MTVASGGRCRPQSFYPADGGDPPLNIALKLCGAYSQVTGLAIRNSYDGSEAGNFGADIDVGVFINSVPFVTLEDVRATGYWRKAGCYMDITRDSISATLDYGRILSCWFQGCWGLWIQGAEPKAGQAEKQDVSRRLREISRPRILRRFLREKPYAIRSIRRLAIVEAGQAKPQDLPSPSAPSTAKGQD